MTQRRPITNDDDAETAPQGPYDDTPAENDLWFLPDDADGEEEPLFPAPRTRQQRLFAPAPWLAAQDALSGPLAELAALFGALDERLRAGPEGQAQRLALLEVADLGWWTGERVAAERLALWVALRLGATGEDAQALARAGWAVRRLSGGPAPAAGGWAGGAAAFLGRMLPSGSRPPEAMLDLAEVMENATGLHPFTEAAVLFHAWRMLGEGPGTDIEAAVMAARHGAAAARGGAVFLPVALTGPDALRATGSEAERLRRWIAGAAQATLAALLQLDRVAAWQVRAAAATQDLSGRTPPALVAALAAWPMLSAPLAESLTGASRAAVQRNLDILMDRRLIREVTGQGRFRVWAALT